MKKTLLSLAIFVAVYSNCFSQRTCGSHSHLLDQITNDPNFAIQLQQIEQQAAAYILSNPNLHTRSVITIPVVFHVVWNSAAENLSDALLYAQIEQLNLDYALLNSDAANIPSAWGSVAANTNIQFCLAVRDPQGNVSTGIERRQSTVTTWSTNDNVKHYANGGLDAWPSSSYLNIWTCNLGGGLLGYSQFPGGAAATDGCVVLYTSVGSMANPNPDGGAYSIGRTSTHEVGHWLNMKHIWGDDGGGCGGSDLVGDTPNQGGENYGCPSFPFTDNCTATSPGVMFMNYMDYTDDACMNMFTSGQGIRMNALFATGGARVSLLNSLGCTPIVLPACTVVSAGTIAASATTLCNGNTSSLTLIGSTGGVAGLTYLWEQSASGTSGWVPAIGTNTNSTYTTPSSAGTTWYQCTVSCASSSASDVSATILISSVGISSVSNDTVCIPGNYDLIANGFGNINWYSDAAGTNILQTGSTLNVSVVNDTVFWVEATSGGANYSSLPSSNSIGTSSLNTTFTNGEVFNAISNFVIDTVFAYPGSTGTIYVNLIDAGTGSVLSTVTKVITSGMIGQKIPIQTSFSCVAGTTYNMNAVGTTVNSGLQRNSNGATHPYTIAGILSITNTINNMPSRYYFFYDWRIHTGCNPGIVPVYMHVGPLTITASASQNSICSGNSTTLIASGGNTYSWMPGSLTGNTVSVSPAVSTTYTVTGNISAGCSGVSTISVAVVAAPTINITSTDDSICIGTQVSLTGTGASTFTWMPGAVSGSIINVTPSTTTTYTATGSNGSCSATSAFAVVVNSASVTATIEAPTDTICKGGSINLSAAGLLNYAWNPGGLTGAVVTVSPVVTTTYTVSGTNAFGCSAQTTAKVVVVNCDGLNEAYFNNNIRVYPNPFSHIISIELMDVEKNTYEINLFNPLGQSLYSSFELVNTPHFIKSISLNHLPAGIYFIQIKNEKESLIQKIIKE